MTYSAPAVGCSGSRVWIKGNLVQGVNEIVFPLTTLSDRVEMHDYSRSRGRNSEEATRLTRFLRETALKPIEM